MNGMGDVFIWGKRGSGKTLKAVFEVLCDWYAGNEIYTNTPLHHAFDTNYKTKESGNLFLVDAIDLIKMLLDDSDNTINPNTPKTLLLDEIKTQGSAREFGSFINKHLTNFVSQARKRNFRIIYTDQILKAYDAWIRQMTDKIIYCKAETSLNDLGWGNVRYPEPLWIEYYEIDLDDDDLEETPPTSYAITRKNNRLLYPLYQTGKIITPVQLKYSNEGGDTK